MEQIRQEQDSAYDTAQQDGENHVGKIRCLGYEIAQEMIRVGRVPEEENHIGRSLRKDFHGLDDRELQRLVLLSQFGEQYRRSTVERQDAAHIDDAVSEAAVAQCRGYLV